MRMQATMLREPGKHAPPSRLLIPVEQPRGRPRKEYRLRVETEEDATILNRHDVPVHALTSTEVTDLGYPVQFPPVLIVAITYRPLIETSMRTIWFTSEKAAQTPRLEDRIVAMLQVDSLGARALLDRNQTEVDSSYLARRIYEESLDRRATFVRFHDVLPQLIPAGDSIDREELERKLAKNPADTGFR